MVPSIRLNHTSQLGFRLDPSIPSILPFVSTVAFVQPSAESTSVLASTAMRRPSSHLRRNPHVCAPAPSRMAAARVTLPTSVRVELQFVATVSDPKVSDSMGHDPSLSDPNRSDLSITWMDGSSKRGQGVRPRWRSMHEDGGSDAHGRWKSCSDEHGLRMTCKRIAGLGNGRSEVDLPTGHEGKHVAVATGMVKGGGERQPWIRR